MSGLRAGPAAATLADRIQAETGVEQKVHLAVLSEIADRIGEIRLPAPLGGVRFVPLPQFSFCIPPSSDLLQLKRRIELALERLRNCLDINGNDLVIVPAGSAAPISPANRAATVTGQQPLPYRYATLVDRANQLLEPARQCEASMLNFIETATQKQYNLLNAQRDLALASATEQLKAVQAQQATQDLTVTTLQRDRAQDQVDKWSQMLRDGLSTWETAGLAAQWSSFALKQSAAFAASVSRMNPGTSISCS